MKKQKHSNICPCDSELDYDKCCARWHAGELVPDAKTLMRSRYSAYVLKLEDYLLATWHLSTRPSSLNLQENADQKWIDLAIKQYKIIDSNTAIVEFVAGYKIGGGRAERLHEISNFILDNGRWFYVDGQFLS